MLKEHQVLIRRSIMFLDILVIMGAFLLAYNIRINFHLFYRFDLIPASRVVFETVGFRQHLIAFFPLIPLWVLMLSLSGAYRSFRTISVLKIFWAVIRAVFLTVLVFSSFAFIFKLEFISRIFFTIFIGFSTFLLVLEKWIVISFSRRARSRGYNYRRLLLVGTGPRAERFIAMLKSHPEWGFKIVGLIDDDMSRVNKHFFGINVIGALRDLADILRRRTIDEVIFIVPRTWLQRIQQSIAICETLGIKASVAADLFDLRIAQAKQDDLGGFPLLSFESTLAKEWQLLLKRAVDLVVSVAGMILILPVFLIVAAVIKFSSKGPIFFRQRRMGLNGRVFTCYKFRSMLKGASKKLDEVKHLNEMDGPVFKIKKDPRITFVGMFLRKISLDELPQLFNIFMGNMSLVGPRPPIPSEVKKYELWQRRRLSMRPGLTCLWQISGRNKISFDRWMELDLQYIDTWSLWLDFKILIKTIPVVAFGIGAH